jgi:hypothetical protein
MIRYDPETAITWAIYAIYNSDEAKEPDPLEIYYHMLGQMGIHDKERYGNWLETPSEVEKVVQMLRPEVKSLLTPGRPYSIAE